MTLEVTNILLAISTTVLAAATVILALSTRKMVSITKASFDLESRAYFAFKGFSFKFFLEKPENESQSQGKGKVRIGLRFTNPGRVLIHYRVKTIRVTFSGATVDDPNFMCMAGSIYPSDDTVFWHGTIPNMDISDMPKTGVVDYEVEYYGMEKKGLFISSRKIQYTIYSIDPSNIEWLYLEQTDTTIHGVQPDG